MHEVFGANLIQERDLFGLFSGFCFDGVESEGAFAQAATNDVQLKVTKDGLTALAKQAIERGTGARALRSIFERLMLDIMFEIPSREDVESVTINAAAVKGDKPPVLKKKRSNAA